MTSFYQTAVATPHRVVRRCANRDVTTRGARHLKADLRSRRDLPAALVSSRCG